MGPKKSDMSEEDKMKKMKAKYGELDTDGNGLLDLNELTVMLKKGNPTFTDAQCQSLYESCDTNGDGTISFDEFLNYVYKGSHSQNRSSAGRHARLSAVSGPVNDGTEVDWRSCQHTFEDYAGKDMDGKEFMKFCKDQKLIDTKTGFKAVDVDLVFSKVVPKGKRRMDFTMFQDACRLIAQKKGCPNRDVQDIVAGASGPELHGTKADYVKFHDDKSTYTGAHQYNEKHEGTDAAAGLARHEKMAAKEKEALAAKEEEENDWGEVERVFKLYAGGSGDLDNKEFAEMCNDIGSLVRGGFPHKEIDVVFSSCVPRGKRRLEFEHFKECVRKISLKKDEACYVTQGCIARSKGPTKDHGTTKAEYVKFHDDKNTYTGSHATDGRHQMDD